jgi:hypothetical protein
MQVFSRKGRPIRECGSRSRPEANSARAAYARRQARRALLCTQSKILAVLRVIDGVHRVKRIVEQTTRKSRGKPTEKPVSPEVAISEVKKSPDDGAKAKRKAQKSRVARLLRLPGEERAKALSRVADGIAARWEREATPAFAGKPWQRTRVFVAGYLWEFALRDEQYRWQQAPGHLQRKKVVARVVKERALLPVSADEVPQNLRVPLVAHRRLFHAEWSRLGRPPVVRGSLPWEPPRPESLRRRPAVNGSRSRGSRRGASPFRAPDGQRFSSETHYHLSRAFG